MLRDNVTYEGLGTNEKVALTVKVSYPHRILRNILPELFDTPFSSGLYYRYNIGLKELKGKGIIDRNGFPTDLAFNIIPPDIKTQMLRDLRNEVKSLYEEKQKVDIELFDSKQKHTELEKSCKRMEDENSKLKDQIGGLRELRDIQGKFDITTSFKNLELSLSESLRSLIERGLERFGNSDPRSTIMNSYLATEILTSNLCKRFYGGDVVENVRSHQHKLNKIANMNELDKRKNPSIEPIASLFSTILWYRNKMGGHIGLGQTWMLLELAWWLCFKESWRSKDLASAKFLTLKGEEKNENLMQFASSVDYWCNSFERRPQLQPAEPVC